MSLHSHTRLQEPHKENKKENEFAIVNIKEWNHILDDIISIIASLFCTKESERGLLAEYILAQYLSTILRTK